MKNEWLILSVFIITASPSSVIIRKCCGHGESLNRQSLCSNETDGNSTDWIPVDPFIINSSKSTNKISKHTVLETVRKIYTGRVDVGFPECDPTWRDLAIQRKDPEFEDQFYLIYDSDKKVRLNLKRDSVYHNNVTLSFRNAFSPESYCVDKGPDDSYVAMLCPCKEITCIRKCCFQDMVFDEVEKKCTHINSLNLTDDEFDAYRDWRPHFEAADYDFDDNEIDVEYFLLSGKLPPCTSDRGLHLERNENYSSLSFTSNGDVKVRLRDGTSVAVPAGEHCGESGWRDGWLSPLLLRCYGAGVAESFAAATRLSGPYGVSLALAAALLALAAGSIAWSGELEERRGARPQLAHVASLAVAHLAAALVYVVGGSGRAPFCVFSGYLMQFSFLASFFWLNIMCVDMSYTFSAFRPTSKGSQKERDRRKFVWYSLYAWGCTSAFTLAALIVDFTPAVPASSPFKPNLGVVKCWFNSSGSLLLYFYGPMGVLLLVNLFLFVYTTWRIIIMSRGSDALHQGDSARHGGSGPSNKDKQRYILYAKMFSLMGVTWLTEIISWAIGGPSYIWYLTDSINLLRAVFIFIIFCWKPRVWTGLRRKFSHIKGTFLKGLGQKYEEHQGPDQSEPSTVSTGSVNKNNSVALEMRSDK